MPSQQRVTTALNIIEQPRLKRLVWSAKAGSEDFVGDFHGFNILSGGRHHDAASALPTMSLAPGKADSKVLWIPALRVPRVRRAAGEK